jgi:hypothetical protein
VARQIKQDYAQDETTAQPKSLLEAPSSELQSDEPHKKDRWVLEIPHEEIPAMAQPLVEQMANDLNTPKDSSTTTRVDNRALKTVIRVVLGVLLICASLVLGLVGFAYWVIEGTATYLILASLMFIGGIVLLYIGK